MPWNGYGNISTRSFFWGLLKQLPENLSPSISFYWSHQIMMETLHVPIYLCFAKWNCYLRWSFFFYVQILEILTSLFSLGFLHLFVSFVHDHKTHTPETNFIKQLRLTTSDISDSNVQKRICNQIFLQNCVLYKLTHSCNRIPNPM